MELDHVVVHIDDDDQILENLRRQSESVGVKIQPRSNLVTSSFKSANIWFGRQYFEIIQILRKDGPGLEKRWVNRYNQGKRGAYCLFLRVPDINVKAQELRKFGMSVEGPKRYSTSALLGFSRKILPWQVIYLPPIPGTDLEIGFIQYDDEEKIAKRAHIAREDKKGVTGFHSAVITLPISLRARDFILEAFKGLATAEDEIKVPIDGGSLTFKPSDKVHVQLIGDVTETEKVGKSISLENVSLDA